MAYAPRVVGVRVLRAYAVELTFDDGAVGTVDFGAEWDFRGVFAPLRDPELFAQVRVLADAGTIGWPGDVDLDPDVLYHQATGAPLPEWASLDDPTNAAA